MLVGLSGGSFIKMIISKETKYGERLSIDRGIVDITGYSGASWVNNVIVAVRRMGTTLMSLNSKAK